MAGKKKSSTGGLNRRLAAWRLRRRRAKQTKRKSGSRRSTIALAVLALLLIGTFLWSQRFLSTQPAGTELSLGQLSSLAADHRVTSATFLDEDNRLIGTYVAQPPPAPTPEAIPAETAKPEKTGKDQPKGKGKGKPAAGEEPLAPPPVEPAPPALIGVGAAPEGAGQFVVAYPKTGTAFAALAQLMAASGADVRVDGQTTKTVVRAVSTYLLPLLILACVFALLFATGKGGSSGIGDVITFGTIGKKRHRKGVAAPTTFADVGSATEAITELKEVVDYLTNPERYDEIGAVPPKGVLLFGPPGCGKTLLAKAVAGEAGVPFFSVAGAEFVESLVGVGAARVRDLFARVRAVAPAIVFIDELDAAGRRRGAGGGEGGSDEREQTLNQLLVEMDGFEVSSGIVVMGATNRPDILDPALLRPGRFDRHITIEQPDHAGRVEILKLHARGKPIAESVDFEYLAKRTPGFSGADLASVINEGALLSIREGQPTIDTADLEEAIQRVLHGPKKRGQVLTPEEERRAAIHESGHALVAAALGRGEDVHRVTILARGRGIGLTGVQTAGGVLHTAASLYAKVLTEMGGLGAEKLVLGDVSTGVEDDLQQATRIARDMVARYGMSPRLGRMRLLASDADQFLGVDAGFAQISPTTHEALDREVRGVLERAEQHAMQILDANRDLLDRLAQTLEEHETLEGAALSELLAQAAQSAPSTFLPFEEHDPVAVANGHAEPIDVTLP
jgi:cell division protease FtsH